MKASVVLGYILVFLFGAAVGLGVIVFQVAQ